MRRFFLLITIIFFIVTMIFSQSGDNRRYIVVKAAVLKNSNGFFASSLAELPLGTEVTLLKEEGKWVQVRTGNLTGWVTSVSLSSRRIVSPGSSATAAEIALAGKGFSPDMEMEYRKNGLDYTVVDSMERMSISSDELLIFITDGRLARGEY